MKVIYLDYYQFRKKYPEEALKLEYTSELFERKRRLDLQQQVYQNILKEVENGDQAKQLHKTTPKNT